MAESQPQRWSRRGANPKLEEVVDIPLTPTTHGEGFKGLSDSVSSTMKTTCVILAWYLSNIGLLLLNKYLLSFYGYKYPIFLTMLHMCACATYSAIAISWLGIVPMQFIGSRKQFLKIVALSCIFSFSVVGGNVSLRYLPVSFNQAVGATTPFFTAIFAILITFKWEAAVVYYALCPVVLGIVIASNSEPSFHMFGFLVCLGSTSARALKSVVQSLLLTSDSEKLHSMNLLMYMAPIAVLMLLPATLLVEGNICALTASQGKENPFMFLLLFGNMTMAYLVNLTNFLVTKHTSPLTLQVLGNAKAAIAVVLSVLIFKNPVTVTGMSGFAVTILGVILYSEAKKRAKQSV